MSIVRVRRWPLATLLLLSFAGCGWGGDPRDFGLSVSPKQINVTAGYTTPAVQVGIAPEFGFDSAVALVVSPPPGLTCLPASCIITTTETDSVFHFDSATSLAPGNYEIPVRATSGMKVRDTSVQVHVVASDGSDPPPAFDFSVSPARYTTSVPSRGSLKGYVSYTFYVTRYNHYTGPIQVTTQLGDDMECRPASCTATITGDSLVAPFVVNFSGDAGFRTVTFTASAPPGSPSPVTHTATAQINIFPPITSKP